MLSYKRSLMSRDLHQHLSYDRTLNHLPHWATKRYILVITSNASYENFNYIWCYIYHNFSIFNIYPMACSRNNYHIRELGFHHQLKIQNQHLHFHTFVVLVDSLHGQHQCSDSIRSLTKKVTF